MSSWNLHLVVWLWRRYGLVAEAGGGEGGVTPPTGTEGLTCFR